MYVCAYVRIMLNEVHTHVHCNLRIVVTQFCGCCASALMKEKGTLTCTHSHDSEMYVHVLYLLANIAYNYIIL